jgi:hypothetical protein
VAGTLAFAKYASYRSNLESEIGLLAFSRRTSIRKYDSVLPNEQQWFSMQTFGRFPKLCGCNNAQMNFSLNYVSETGFGVSRKNPPRRFIMHGKRKRVRINANGNSDLKQTEDIFVTKFKSTLLHNMAWSKLFQKYEGQTKFEEWVSNDQGQG